MHTTIENKTIYIQRGQSGVLQFSWNKDYWPPFKRLDAILRDTPNGQSNAACILLPSREFGSQ